MKLHFLVLLLAACSPVFYAKWPVVQEALDDAFIHRNTPFLGVFGGPEAAARRATVAEGRPSFIRMVQDPSPLRKGGDDLTGKPLIKADQSVSVFLRISAVDDSNTGGAGRSRYASRTVYFDGFARNRKMEFITGQKMVMRAVDEAVQQMPLNSHAIFEVSSDKAFGRKGFHKWDIPPHADLRIELEVEANGGGDGGATAIKQ